MEAIISRNVIHTGLLSFNVDEKLEGYLLKKTVLKKPNEKDFASFTKYVTAKMNFDEGKFFIKGLYWDELLDMPILLTPQTPRYHYM